MPTDANLHGDIVHPRLGDDRRLCDVVNEVLQILGVGGFDGISQEFADARKRSAHLYQILRRVGHTGTGARRIRGGAFNPDSQQG